MKNSRLIGGVCAVVAAQAHAQLWNTGPWDTREGRSSDKATPAVRPETRAADDVLLPAGNGQPYTITGLSGRMLAVRYTTAFAEIYADAGGAPAATPSFTLTAQGNQVLQTGVFNQYDLVNVTLNTAGVSLAPGRWWVSVVFNVSGNPAPNDGYAFFATGGNQVVQGLAGRYRVGTGAWTPIVQALGYDTDFSFTLQGQQNAPSCYANCDSSTNAPILNIFDFNCFLNRFFSNDTYANCDGSTNPPVLNISDFTCFLNRFFTGCS